MEKTKKFLNLKLILALAVAGVFANCPGALAADYGTEITIYDGIGSNGSGIYKEDNEAEPGMVQSQVWDLEGFFLKNKALTIVGGYNFYTGYNGMDAGDIFVDIDGDAVFSPNVIPGYNYNPGYNQISNSLLKYDYVLDINWGLSTYDIVKLNTNSMLMNTLYGEAHNKASNPWIYMSGGDVISSASFLDYGKVSQNDTGLLGWNGNNKHFAATFNIDEINMSNGALFHNTMECGNDNLLGMAEPIVETPVPEPSTMLLGALAFAGMAFKRRNANRL